MTTFDQLVLQILLRYVTTIIH